MRKLRVINKIFLNFLFVCVFFFYAVIGATATGQNNNPYMIICEDLFSTAKKSKIKLFEYDFNNINYLNNNRVLLEPRVKNQCKMPICWSFALNSWLELLHVFHKNAAIELDEKYLVFHHIFSEMQSFILKKKNNISLSKKSSSMITALNNYGAIPKGAWELDDNERIAFTEALKNPYLMINLQAYAVHFSQWHERENSPYSQNHKELLIDFLVEYIGVSKPPNEFSFSARDFDFKGSPQDFLAQYLLKEELDQAGNGLDIMATSDFESAWTYIRDKKKPIILSLDFYEFPKPYRNSILHPRVFNPKNIEPLEKLFEWQKGHPKVGTGMHTLIAIDGYSLDESSRGLLLLNSFGAQAGDHGFFYLPEEAAGLYEPIFLLPQN